MKLTKTMYKKALGELFGGNGFTPRPKLYLIGDKYEIKIWKSWYGDSVDYIENKPLPKTAKVILTTTKDEKKGER